MAAIGADIEDDSLRWTSCEPRLSPSALSAIKALGFARMTPVQGAAIPAFLSHKDVCVQACTGSGKTLAFLVPVFEMLARRTEPLKPGEVGAVVISPTRELALQIFAVAQHLALHYAPRRQLNLLSLIGGTGPLKEQELMASGANVVVATPGRLEQTVMHCRAFDVRQLEALVLDEADRLLDMGFHASLTAIMARLPKQRRTGLFSATQTREVSALARAGMRNPVLVDVKVEFKSTAAAAAAGRSAPAGQITPSTLRNTYVVLGPRDKLAHLAHFIETHPTHKVIVFFLTCACVDYFARVLGQLPRLAGRAVVPLHGQMVTKKRTGNYERFAAAPSATLLCTDLAARGLDLPDVDYIVQYDPPQDPSFFVHRVGRTARMGRSGRALLYLMPREEPFVDYVRLQRAPVLPERSAELGTGEEAPWRAGRDALLEAVRGMCASDRDVMERGQRAFVSYVRAYKEHKCKYIFLFHRLDFGGLAEGMGLLFMPRMPDLKHFAIEFPEFGVRAADIKYQNAARERQRQANSELYAKKRTEEKLRRLEKQKARDKAKRKEEPKRRRKRTNQEIAAEWSELQREARLLKKLKQGKITKKEFEAAADGGSSGEEGEEEEEQEEEGQGQAEDKDDRSDGDDDDDDDDDEEEEEEEPPAKRARTAGGSEASAEKRRRKNRRKKQKRKEKKAQERAAAAAAE